MGRLYGGQSAQERSEGRRRQFLDAGLEVLGTRGWANSTVRAICDEAGLSTRFFYESFASLEALAVELYDEVVTATFVTVVDALSNSGTTEPLAQARVGVEAMVTALADDPRRARIALVHAFDNPALAARRRELMRQLTSITAEFGRAAYDTREYPDNMVQMTSTLVAGGVSELMLAYVDGALDVTRAELIDGCARLVIGVGDAADAMVRDND